MTLQQAFAFDDDEDVEFGRRKAPRLGLVLFELWRIRAKQLTERIIESDPAHPSHGQDRQNPEQDGEYVRKMKRNQSDAFEPES